MSATGWGLRTTRIMCALWKRRVWTGWTRWAVSVECVYRRPTTFKDVVAIEVKVAEMSALKITFGYTMRVGDKVVCTGRSVHCFMEKGKPVKLAERFPQLYEAAVNSLTC